MKKLILVGLLTVLIGVPIGNAFAQDTQTGPVPSTFGDPGFYLYFPIVPSGFNGYDTVLFLTGLGLAGAALEVNTTGVLPGAPAQALAVDVRPLEVRAVFSNPGVDPLNFNCVPRPQICQVFVHRRNQPVQVQNFTATLLIFNVAGGFQFLPAPYAVIFQ
jgi:hypothetical protein